jgi:hypothetical protein
MLAGASDMSDSGTYSLLEDGCIGVSNGFPDLLLCSVRAHNAVLALSSGLRVSPEIGLECLVLVDGGLEAAVDLADLGRVPGAAGLGLALDVLDARDEAAVACHDLCAEVVDLARGHVRAGQDLSKDALEVGELAIEVVERAVYVAAFVKDGIGVCGCAALGAVVLHLQLS